MALVIDRLVKRFGDVQALAGISFAVEAGEVFGFLGANGAGKTTTMRIALGLMKADSGTVTWGGRPAREWPRRTWGYMPEERGLYEKMRVIDQLVHLASLYGVPRRRARVAAGEWLERFRLSDKADRRLDALSKGNQQKVQYIATILHEPDVLLMDEPFAGLDPVNVAMLKEAFLDMRDRGRTLVFSTHQLEQAEALCSSVAIIDHGRVVAAGATRDVRRSTGQQVVRVAVEDPNRGWLRDLPDVTMLRDGADYAEVAVTGATTPQDILSAAIAHGPVLRFEVADPSLEQVFVERVAAHAPDEPAPATAGAAS